MRKLIYATIAAVALLGAVVIDSVWAYTHPAPLAEPMMKVVLAGGHGSAVHIGNGFAFTAAHVVGDATEVDVLDSLGATMKAEVLWVNKARDIALLRLGANFPAAANLSCRTPGFGEFVEARGNPANLEFISTWGRVGGKALSVGPWREVVPVSMTIVPGQSGGALYDGSGALVGILVGVMVAPAAFTVSMVGVGYAVPGTQLCSLLARGGA